MNTDPVKSVERLAMPWATMDPFLFCVFHVDHYPQGNAALGPEASLAGRQLGQDFDPGNDWRMYHGQTVPGFPAHPHRGFETITVVTRGFVDHADSMNAAGRYGAGDTQWMTAGRGVQHAEMFPLLNPAGDNPLELYQIWLNLPARNKMVEPHFAMLWKDAIPVLRFEQDGRPAATITLVAGSLDGQQAPPPPPESWAAEPENHVAVWLVRIEAGCEWTLPAGAANLNRRLYCARGEGARIGNHDLPANHAATLLSDQPVSIAAGAQTVELLMLQGKPIGELVVQYGPFVMNTQQEVQQAFRDFQAGKFGAWTWDRTDPVHGPEPHRFARHADGSEEYP